MNNELDLFVKCSRCLHQKADHDINTNNRDKRKCLVGACLCKGFLEDRKYYRSSKK